MKCSYNDAQGWPLNVRENPSLNAPVIGRIPDGSTVEVEFEEDGWAAIMPNGYCMVKFLEPVPEDDPSALESMLVADLKKLAADSGIKLKTGMKKAEIIAAILEG